MGHHHHLETLHPQPAPGFLASNQRTESAFEQIPIIDISESTSHDPAARRVLADRIRDACVNVGFFYVTNHGVEQGVIEGAVEAGKRFFARPTEEKMKLDIHKTANYKGYTALLGENTDPTGKGDMHEGFDIGWDAGSGGESSATGHDMAGGNVWPDLPDDSFKDPVLQYYHAAVELGQRLFPLFALALDLPENFFEDKTTKPAAIMRLLHYPPQNATPETEDGTVIGIGAHTDYECFTILWQDKIPALQVMNTEKRWIDAVPIPGTFVVNLGDQLARWTNDVFKSTVHRAVNKSGTERYSMPLFFGTDYNVRLEPISGCVSEDNPAKYEVVTAGDYVKSRLEATYAESKM
ncbi:Clavaminate synthase-like protein [Cylindrobasidium torrendii FP15055 ss-10]|uniref:Clavaminate synthase-like protein n=1 Tax=Cylindrobasidium torrendii FP15055 ss-10 TaxID=1314674 RepID=A0A0D7AVG1_9AGAR|nr:Clavaminate synthase-like protein [Cylindrobasidium torrendii FP15055 ss-10]